MSSDDERPKRSWREIDQLRSGARVERGPRGKAAEARAAEQARTSLREADGLFASPRAVALGSAVRDARGTPDFDAACEAYRSELGMPGDPALLSLLLDASDSALLADALEALLGAAREARLESSPGLRTRLRLLAEHSDDNVAGAAEDLLEIL